MNSEFNLSSVVLINPKTCNNNNNNKLLIKRRISAHTSHKSNMTHSKALYINAAQYNSKKYNVKKMHMQSWISLGK